MFKARDPRTDRILLGNQAQNTEDGPDRQWIPDSKYAYIDRGVSETEDVNIGIKVETIAACAWDSKELIDRLPGWD